MGEAARLTWNVLDLIEILLPEQLALLKKAMILEVMQFEQTMCERVIVILKFVEVFWLGLDFAQLHLIGVIHLACGATDFCIWGAQKLQVSCERIAAILFC